VGLSYEVFPPPTLPGAYCVARTGPFIIPTVELDGFDLATSADQHARDLTRAAFKREEQAKRAREAQDRRAPVAGFYTNDQE
jgi:hypothetical protein